MVGAPSNASAALDRQHASGSASGSDLGWPRRDILRPRFFAAWRFEARETECIACVLSPAGCSSAALRTGLPFLFPHPSLSALAPHFSKTTHLNIVLRAHCERRRFRGPQVGASHNCARPGRRSPARSPEPRRLRIQIPGPELGSVGNLNEIYDQASASSRVPNIAGDYMSQLEFRDGPPRAVYPPNGHARSLRTPRDWSALAVKDRHSSTLCGHRAGAGRLRWPTSIRLPSRLIYSRSGSPRITGRRHTTCQRDCRKGRHFAAIGRAHLPSTPDMISIAQALVIYVVSCWI
jgi:hypothetical protein